MTDTPLLENPPRKPNGTIDHSGCVHELTPAGRRACRAYADAYATKISGRAAVLLRAADASGVMSRRHLIQAAARLRLVDWNSQDAVLAARALAGYRDPDDSRVDGITWHDVCMMHS